LAIVLAAGGFWGWLGYSSEARVQAKLELAIKYLSENDYEKAILEFNEAIKIDPRNIEARVGLAQAYIGIGDTQKADEVMTEAMNIGTLSPGQYQKVIEMYIKKGDYEEAAKLLAQARGKYPDNEALKAIEQVLAEAKAKAEAINRHPRWNSRQNRSRSQSRRKKPRSERVIQDQYQIYIEPANRINRSPIFS
jgi:Tfp pilus assembly protein PilF